MTLENIIKRTQLDDSQIFKKFVDFEHVFDFHRERDEKKMKKVKILDIHNYQTL